MLTGQHPNLRPGEFGMPELSTAELGCTGKTDPSVHAGLVARAIGGALEGVQLVVVQGDTSSALGGALGSARAGVPVAHVEAGLRSHDRLNPWPEEEFRIAIDSLSILLFAPTELNAANLRREKAAGRIYITGNTGIDALLERARLLGPKAKLEKRQILITCHRRESWDALVDIASGLIAIAKRADVAITFVLHPNPRVAGEMVRLIGRTPGIDLREPCGHLEMLQLMRDSDLIISDSGGMQEEAPALGVPLLILRDRTERPEGIASGNAILVGRRAENIISSVERLLDSDGILEAMSSPALPYGDGCAAPRVAGEIANWLVAETDEALRAPEPRSPLPRSATALTVR